MLHQNLMINFYLIKDIMLVSTNMMTELSNDELLSIDGGDFLGDLAYNVGFAAGIVTVSALQAVKMVIED